MLVENKNERVYLKDIKAGEVFRNLDDSYCIKLVTMNLVNVARLRDGQTLCFNEEEHICYRVDAKVVILGEGLQKE